jgi:hypothetical protein
VNNPSIDISRSTKSMSSDPWTKAEIRARIAAALREQLDEHIVAAAFADGPERNRHIRSIDFIQMMFARGAAMQAAETRH